MELTLAEMLRAEFDRETAITRRLLGLAPESRSGWRPFADAPALGQLVMEVSARPEEVAVLLEAAGPDRWVPRPVAVPFESMNAALRMFDAGVARSRRALAATSDVVLRALVPAVDEHGVDAARTRLDLLRTFAFSRMIHERAQLSVYLRLCDVRLPPIYGPAVDPPPE
jgi:nucleoside-diphosphate-sugar epimerase